MSKPIKHAGIIDSIEGTHVRVKIVQSPACASCQVASHCNAAEAQEKLIDIYSPPTDLRVGQAVTIKTSDTVARLSVLIGFICPLLLLISTLLAAKMTGSTDASSAILAISSLIPYYIAVWFLRKRIAKSITFQIDEDDLSKTN